MERTIIVVLCLVAASSLLLNIVLFNAVKELKLRRKVEKRSQRKFTRSLIKSSCIANEEAGKCKEQIKNLQSQIDIAADLLEEYKDIALHHKKRYDDVLNGYLKVTGTLCDFIRDGRVIKTKYMGKVIPYDFNSLTVKETEELFGQQII